jgi:hypothetical protein
MIIRMPVYDQTKKNAIPAAAIIFFSPFIKREFLILIAESWGVARFRYVQPNGGGVPWSNREGHP